MSVQAESLPVDNAEPRAVARWWPMVDRAMEWTGDRLNPILVKETRQALKSRQFAVTFGLLLICGWVWTILGVAMIGPGIWYNAQGAGMFFGYYMILAFPLLVIVPFGAFRSLAVEQEDRTYELMSITTLGPRHIVRGKLGSAVLQMLVYLSAISPCLAFTYMLRGIDFPTILFILYYVILASLVLGVIALVVGTVTAERHWQVVLSVLLIAGLLAALITSFMMVAVSLSELHVIFTEEGFWQVNAGILTAYVSYFVLLFYAASAQLTFPTENRSLRLRVTMLVQQVLLVGWLAWVWISPAAANGEEEMFLVFMCLIGAHSYVMGAFMTGQSAELSSRVKRQLPQSFLGRAFLTWFNPGPGTGYVFIICNLLAALAMAAVGLAVVDWLGWWRPPSWSSRYSDRYLAFGVLGLAYVTIYLGIGLLLVRLLRKVCRVSMLLAVLVNVLLLLAGSVVPMIIHLMSVGMRNSDYNLLHVTDPFWSLLHVVDRPMWPAEVYVLLLVVPMAAVIVFLLNLPGIARELRHVRIAKPQRVAEEDAALIAAKVPAEPVRKSPWD